MAIPPPPLPLPDPLEETWPAGREIVRCHPVTWGATEFNDAPAIRRFRHFLTDDGRIVPTMYGSNGVGGALSETVFHDVPVRGPGRSVDVTRLRHWVISRIVPLRDLKLAALRGRGLRRLQVTRAELIESPAAEYEQTVPWGRAIWEHAARYDGLIWTSRQDDTAAAVMLFGRQGGRGVSRSDLEPNPNEATMLIWEGSGLDEVQAFGADAGIDIIR